MTKATRDILLTALAPMAWGTTYLVTTELLPPGRPLLVAMLRALPVGLLMLAICRRLPAGVWWKRSVILGSLNIGFFFALLFLSAYRLPGGVAAILGSIQPLVAALCARIFLGERPSAYTLGAGLAGLVGVGLIVLGPAATLDPLGVAAGLGATLSMALGTALTRRWGRPVPLPVFTAWQLVAGGLVLAPLTWLIEGPLPEFTLRNLTGLAYLGIVGSGLAYALWFRGIERLGAAASFLPLISPVVAVVLGLTVLHQTLTLAQVAGILLVLGSVFAGQYKSVSVPQIKPRTTSA